MKYRFRTSDTRIEIEAESPEAALQRVVTDIEPDAIDALFIDENSKLFLISEDDEVAACEWQVVQPFADW